ncbi:MAG: hypothetical protein COT14_02120 [Candidatus Diapherotrites archaeon CG08_land_8_20_14_0_20_30_16]|nr:MAG: hypothetical protein COT14_02120 [Candidatus Diapherotrites archaeon CG08_land_8_20_14_0_20_30_16]
MLLKNISKKIQKREAIEEKKARATSIKEGVAYSVSEGFGTNYITPYALSIGANNAQIGILKSLPQLVGTFAQLYTIKEMWKYNRKKIVFIGVLIQAILWLAIISVGTLYFVFGLYSKITPTLLIIVYTLLIAFGTATIPAWSSWMKDLVPEKLMGKYFGNRNKILGSVVLLSLLGAGFVLDYFKQTYLFLGFVILFGLAFIGRLISVYYLKKQYEPEFEVEREYYFTFRQFVKKLPYTNFGKFVIFYGTMLFATSIAVPFFAVYMLTDLEFSYLLFTIILIVGTASRLLFMPLWGKLSDKYGNVTTIKNTAKMIPFVPLLWFLSPLIIKLNPSLILPYLIIVEGFSGFCWAGFDLSASNFIYATVSRQKMALCVTYHSIITNVGVFVGTIIGGIIATLSISFWWITPLLFVFLLSFVLRAVSCIFFLSKIKEERTDVKQFKMELEAKKELKMFSPKHLLQHMHLRFKL